MEIEINQLDWTDYKKNESTEMDLVGNWTNASVVPVQLPIDMQFNDGHLLSIVVYSILFVVATVGNITVLAAILKFRPKPRLSRINLFLLHLVIADLMVTFLLMPLEIGWASTVSWKAGDTACRILSFFRTFGLYLSGFLIVCISLDRFFAVIKPLGLPDANRRGKIMLYAAWIGSVVCSFPQALIFHVERHPDFLWFEQCVTFNSFPTKKAELAYSIFGFVMMYGFPLSMILFCYSRILFEIYKINRLSKNGGDDIIRRSNLGALGRAKVRTLKLTIVIVTTFFLCWTPYNVMSLWYWIDHDSAIKVDQRIQKCLFLFACTNSCFNPMVYGLFHRRTKSFWIRLTAKRRNNLKKTYNGRYGNQPTKAQPYKVRVRWTPRECLCGTTSSSGYSTSTNNLRMRPLYEINGIPVYYNNIGKGQVIIDKNYQPTSVTKSLVKTVQVDVNDCGSGGRNEHQNHHYANGRCGGQHELRADKDGSAPKSKTLVFHKNYLYSDSPERRQEYEHDLAHFASQAKQGNSTTTVTKCKASKTNDELKNHSVCETSQKSTSDNGNSKTKNPSSSDKFWSADLSVSPNHPLKHSSMNNVNTDETCNVGLSRSQ